MLLPNKGHKKLTSMPGGTCQVNNTNERLKSSAIKRNKPPAVFLNEGNMLNIKSLSDILYDIFHFLIIPFHSGHSNKTCTL